ncbi:hypothetical protein KIPB_012852, partial [Kipferlia bialata]
GAFVELPPFQQQSLTGVVASSAIVDSGSGSGGMDGMDDGMDPELAMALRLSMQEQTRHTPTQATTAADAAFDTAAPTTVETPAIDGSGLAGPAAPVVTPSSPGIVGLP